MDDFDATLLDSACEEWMQLVWCICRFDQDRRRAKVKPAAFYKNCRSKRGCALRRELGLVLTGEGDYSSYEVMLQLQSLLRSSGHHPVPRALTHAFLTS
jgi:hypothetical protein